MVFNKLTTTTIKKQLHILETRFVICFLFFCCFSSVCAQIHVTEGTTFYNPDSRVKISNSSKVLDEKSSEIVYASAVTTVNKTDSESDFKNVKIESPQVRSVKKARLASSRSSDLAKNQPKKDFERKIEKEFASQHVFSGKISSEIVFSSGSKFSLAVLSFSNPIAKEVATTLFSLNNFQQIKISSESDVFLYSDFVFSSHHFTSFSVRPPPFFV